MRTAALVVLLAGASALAPAAARETAGGCEQKPKPAYACPAGYEMTCLGDNWQCAKAVSRQPAPVPPFGATAKEKACDSLSEWNQGGMHWAKCCKGGNCRCMFYHIDAPYGVSWITANCPSAGAREPKPGYYRDPDDSPPAPDPYGGR